MSLTPSEILHKEFDTKFRGYDPDAVNDFLDLIVVEFEKLTTTNNEMTLKINDLTEKVNYFKQLQDSLNNSIMVAQEAAERLKQNARKEAELILFEAEREADRIVEEATDKSANIKQEAEQLYHYSIGFRSRLKAMVEEQLSLLNNEDSLQLVNDANTHLLKSVNHMQAPTAKKSAVLLDDSQTETSSVAETSVSVEEVAPVESVEVPVVTEQPTEIKFARAGLYEEETDEYMDKLADDILLEDENLRKAAEATFTDEVPNKVETVNGRTVNFDLPK